MEDRFPTDDLRRAMLEVISGGHRLCIRERDCGVLALPADGLGRPGTHGISETPSNGPKTSTGGKLCLEDNRGALRFKVGLLNQKPRSVRFTAWSLALNDQDSGRTETRSAVSGPGRKHMLEIDQDGAKGL